MRTICAIVVALVIRAAPAGAQLIGGPGTGENGLPFTFTGATRDQQVYAASRFSAGTITGLRFFRTVNPDGTGDVANAR